MPQGSSDLLSGLLKDVSRSFYLTLRVLPRSIRPQIGLAYLLARASDTIADTDAVAPPERLVTLLTFRDQILGRAPQTALDLSRFSGAQSSTSERALLQRLDEALATLATLRPPDLPLVRSVLETIISGQRLDVERFASADAKRIVALQSDAELDDYTYRVAGCVGEFWTRICRAHVFPEAQIDDSRLLANGIRFGKGLQLVNILRDLAADLRIGRCYLPLSGLQVAELAPSDLLDPANEARLRPLYSRYLDLAEDHLHAGWSYTNDLPRRNIRLRLACAWPILIGMETIGRLRANQILDPGNRVKISRRQVRAVIWRSIAWYGWPRKWRELFELTKASRPGGKL